MTEYNKAKLELQNLVAQSEMNETSIKEKQETESDKTKLLNTKLFR